MRSNWDGRPILVYLVLPVASSLITAVVTIFLTSHFSDRHSLRIDMFKHAGAPASQEHETLYVVTALNDGNFTEQGVELELFILGQGGKTPFVPFMMSSPWSIADDVEVKRLPDPSPAVAKYRLTLDRLNADESFQVQFTTVPGARTMASLRSEHVSTEAVEDIDLAHIYSFPVPQATP